MATRIREKANLRALNADLRPRATAKYIRISPSKVNIVLDTIRGLKYREAAAILKVTNRGSSAAILKVLNSAAANAENNNNLSKADLFIAAAYANEGPTLKRMRPRAKGRGARINKRTSHITIILDDIANKEVSE